MEKVREKDEALVNIRAIAGQGFSEDSASVATAKIATIAEAAMSPTARWSSESLTLKFQLMEDGKKLQIDIAPDFVTLLADQLDQVIEGLQVQRAQMKT